MKRAFPLLVLVIALGGVAITLLNSGGDTPALELEPTPTVQGPSQNVAELPREEPELSALPAIPARRDAGDAAANSAGMAGVETRTLEGWISLPLGTPADPSLRVVAISIEGDEEEAFVEKLKEIGETDPELMRELALEFREKMETEPYEGRPFERVEVEANGEFSFEVTEAADRVELRIEGRYLYLEDLFIQDVEEGQRYELEPMLGARLAFRVSPPVAADAAEKLEAIERFEVSVRGSESGGMMGMWRSSETIDLEHLGDGLFEARALPTELFWLGRVESPDYIDARTDATKLEPGEDRELSVALELGARLSGRAINEQGEPIEGVEVSIRPTNDTRFWMSGGSAQTDQSDADGRFELRGIPAGEVRLTGSIDGLKNPEAVELELGDRDTRTEQELIFIDGLSIRGLVLWSDGAPVEGARVGVETGDRPQTQRWGRSNEQLWVTTDETGAFSLTGLETGAYRIRANQESPEGSEDKGRWRGVKDEVSAGTSGVEIRLEEPGVVRGRVVNASGTPFTGEEADEITVVLNTVRERDASVQSAHGSIYQRGEVEADGSFQVSGIFPAEYEVDLSSDVFVHTEPDQKYIHPGSELIVRVSRGASITGLVLDPSGAPVAGCEVTASTGDPSRGRWGGGSSESEEAVSEADGSFSIQGLKEGKYKLSAESEEWAGNMALEVQVAEGEAVAGVTVQLLRGGTIVGTVFGENGQPVAGRSVMVSQGGFMGMGGNMGGEETTDGAGRFVVERVTPGSYQVMTQPTMEEISEVFEDGDREPGFADFMTLVETVSVDIADGETVEVVLGAPPAAPVVVSGRVLDGDQPITTGSVLAVADGQGFMEGSETARIDGSGRYEMTLDAPGDYVFLVQGAGEGFGGFGVDFPVTVPEAERFNFDITMPSSGIRGVVIGSDGAPRGRIAVSLRPVSNMAMSGVSGMRYENAGEDGEFSFLRLRPGSYIVQAGGRTWRSEPTGAVSTIVNVGDGELSELRLELQDPGTVEGIVRAQDGSPVEGASVFFRTAAGTVQTSRQPVISGSDGKFRHNGLAPGPVTVIARSTSGSTQESATVEVRAGDISTVELLLEEGTTLLCVCEGSDGEPLRASISVLDEAGREQTSLRTREQWMEVFTGGGEQRETRVGPLPPGKYEVIFTTDDGETARRVVRLTGRPERKVRVRIRD
ncbi:MAG: carboxypeptidase-like regulatory domain-containing protein [Planctomycetes bacterium]|nr:carboxypeptidase-like regulatory domain-containing protein [Planctomycetota bacterium]